MKKKVLMIITVTVTALFVLMAACKVTGDDDNGETGNAYFVSINGNDSNDGSESAPWRTVQHGLDQLQPGDSLTIQAGSYSEALQMTTSGTEDRKIQIKGQSYANTFLDGEDVSRDLLFVDNANYIEISDLTFARAPRAGLRLSHSDYITVSSCVFANHGRWGVFTDFSDNTRIQNCEAYGSEDEHGIYISNSSDNAVIRNNFVHHNNASGIQINADPSMGDDGISSNCLIENNIIYENGSAGGAAINLASVRNSTIQNNVIYHNYAGGIAAWDDGQGYQWGCSGLTIIFNSIYFRPNEGRWAISLKNGSSGATVLNNIMSGGSKGGFEFNSNVLSGSTINYNIYYRYNSIYFISNEDQSELTLAEWQLNGYGNNSYIGNPDFLFQNPDRGNFHLDVDAIAINRAIDTGLTYDYEGTTRPVGSAPDIGADEKE